MEGMRERLYAYNVYNVTHMGIISETHVPLTQH